MPKNFSRTQRVADLIHRILARIIREEFKDPRVGMITLSDVEVTPDLKVAKVYVSVLEEAKVEETIKVLNDAAGFFRSQLASSISLRVIPKPRFIYDDSVVRGNRIDKLLNESNLDE
jgi:ribosome-binding factor A